MIKEGGLQKLAEKQSQTSLEREMAHRAAEQWAAGMMQQYRMREKQERAKKRNPLRVNEQLVGMRLQGILLSAGWNPMQGWR